jgi:two-component system response regulator AtoC
MQNRPSCEHIIDMLPEPFVVIDRDYQILAANRAYRNHYGVNHGDVVGRHCYEVSHRSAVPCSECGEHCPLESVFATRQSTHVMHIHYRGDGEEEHVQIQGTPILGDQGEVLYMGEYIHPVNPAAEGDPILIGRSRTMLRLTSLLQRVAPTDTTVLLLGESGVGKERVAEYIHQYSLRVDGPLVVVDCGTLGENLIESELFGHEKGAFTGAAARRKGLVQAANGGTLFIDEVGDLPLSLQTKLLRVLETGTVRRLGGTDYMDVNVRVVAATNHDLQAMVSRGDFRQDLYYRLSAFPVQVPALREHKDDIPALAEHFLSRIADGDRYLPLSPELIETLLGYDYPGNVRQLRNIIERAAILACGDALGTDHLVFEGPSAAIHHHERSVREPDDLLVRRGRLDDQAVIEALRRSDGHRAKAAHLLGVSERTLYRYMRRLRTFAGNHVDPD